MEHRIRTAAGISKGKIRFAEEETIKMSKGNIELIQGKTGGIGQGGGGGPMAWISVIAIMVEAYRQLCSGAEATDVINIYSLVYWIVSYVDDNTLVTTFRDIDSEEMTINKMKENLRSWQRLLQLTGGDIDRDKSQWCLLKWKYDRTWGTAKLLSKKESRRQITLTSPIENTGNEESLQRLDPWEADRVLGVRLPMDGNMNEEYKYRIEQIIGFTRRLNGAPLNHYDANIVYECRYRATVSYPLPVTAFSEKQCHSIQRPFMAALLPKMGLNRNMPRAIIYGPTELGGRGLMDLRIEQKVHQWETTIGHLRREDRVGKGLMITLNDHQCYIGSGKPFLQLNPDTYGYGDQNTRWRYTWKMLWEAKLTTKIYNQWVPKGRNEDDVNIMDVAVRDSELIGKKWPMLEHINSCRLYLQVFYISELSDDGKKVNIEYLNGTKRKLNKLMTIPEIQRPTELQWRLWKAFIFRNFLSPGTSINPPIDETEIRRKKFELRRTEAEMVSNLYTIEDKSMEEIINELPQSLRVIMGETYIPNDDGLEVGESIVRGECIAASDGGLVKEYQNERGGYGYVISDNGNIKSRIEGTGVCPLSDSISSQTAEHYGVIGLLCILHVVSIRYKLTKEECFDKVVIAVDNKNVVERMRKEQQPFNIRDFGVPDYDLWKLSSELVSILPIEVEFTWIKAHQNENGKGEIINGPFNKKVQTNIRADELATNGVKQSKNTQVIRPELSTTKVGLRDVRGREIINIRKYLEMRTNGKEILKYYDERRNWKEGIIKTIDWEGLNALIKRAGPIQKNRIIQVLHNWQNVGHQKGKFRDARLGREIDPPLQPTEDEKTIHLCPNGCGMTEKSMHYVHCQEDSSKNKRNELRKAAIRKMANLKTDEGIRSLVNYIIKKISNDEEIDIEDDNMKELRTKEYRKVLEGQKKIGWKEMIQGYVHIDWVTIQAIYYRRQSLNKRLYNIKRWRRKFIEILTEYGKECWKMRNEAIHGTTVKEGRELRLERLRKQVEEIYKKRRTIKGEDAKRLFAIPMKKRMKFGIQALTLWVGKAEEVLKLNREQADKYTIHRWLECR